ncbi:MAG: histidine kinase N-terminal 7TM domain-containing protein, partial [Candidatus Saccharimonadales bacterium]
MYYQILPLIITSFLIAILGLVVFLRNIRNKTNIYYLLFTLSVAAWVLTNALFQVEGYQYVMAFLSYGAAALIALFALLFSIRFSNINSKPTNIALVSIALLVTIGAMIPGIVASDVVGSTIITTPALYLYGLYIFVYFGLCVYYLAQSFSKSIGVDRLRSGLVLFGFFLALLVGAFFNLVLPLFNIYDYVNIGPLASLILVSSMAYAIVKHRLFDIRLVVARSLAYILVILTLGLVYGYFVFGFVDQFFPDTGTSTLQQALYTISAVFLVFTFQPLKRFFDKLTNKLFYRDSYNSEDALNRLGKVFVAKSNSFELLDDSLDIIVDT